MRYLCLNYVPENFDQLSIYHGLLGAVLGQNQSRIPGEKNLAYDFSDNEEITIQ